MDWLDKRFRRQPFPDKTYREALETAIAISWNIDSVDGREVNRLLVGVEARMHLKHHDFPDRSQQHVAEFNELWRGKVTTLLKWFQTKGAAK